MCSQRSPELLGMWILLLLLNEQKRNLPAVMYIVTHSTNDDAVPQTKRLPQDSELLSDLIGQLPA